MGRITFRVNDKGFTLIELIVVLILLSILAAVAAPRFLDLINPSKENVTKYRLEELKKAIVGNPDVVAAGTYSARGFRGDVGSFPVALTDLVSQGGYPVWNRYTRKGWNGPYVDASAGQYLIDARNNNFTYQPACTPVRIISNGANGVLDTVGCGAVGGDDIFLELRF